MLEDASIETLSQNRGENIELTDPQVLDIVMYVVHELADEGKIKCRCEVDGEYDVEIHDDHLTVVCNKCGACLEIRTNSLTAATDFLASEELVLK